MGQVEGWTPDLVREEMVEALRWARQAAGPVGPRGIKSGMPAIVMTHLERMAEDWPGIQELERQPKPKRYSPAQVSHFERVIEWQLRYLREAPTCASMLGLWLACKVSKGVTFGKACDAQGIVRATAYRYRDKALSWIAQGLEADGVPTPRGS